MDYEFEEDGKIDEMLRSIKRWEKAAKRERGKEPYIELSVCDMYKIDIDISNGSLESFVRKADKILKAKVQYLPAESYKNHFSGCAQRQMDDILRIGEKEAWSKLKADEGSDTEGGERVLKFPKNSSKSIRISEGIEKNFLDTPSEEIIDFSKMLHDIILDKGASEAEVKTRVYLAKEIYADSLGTNIVQDHSRFMAQMKACIFVEDREDRKLEMNERVGAFGGAELLKRLERPAVDCASNLSEKCNLFKNVNHTVGDFVFRSGVYPIILTGSIAGTSIHESGVGHLTEASRFVGTADTSLVITQNIEKKYAIDELTIIDDSQMLFNGLRPFSWYKYDNEGVEGKKTYLIKDGILTGLLHTKESAGTLEQKHGIKTELTGNARCSNTVEDDLFENYDAEQEYEPESRMSTLSILPYSGGMSLEEMKEEIAGKGLLLSGHGSGGVFTDSAQGVISFQEMYFVDRNAELVPVKGFYSPKLKLRPRVTINADVQSFMLKIKHIGNKSTVCFEDAYCGADSGYIPQSISSPSLLLDGVSINIQEPSGRDKMPIVPYDKWEPVNKFGARKVA